MTDQKDRQRSRAGEHILTWMFVLYWAVTLLSVLLLPRNCVPWRRSYRYSNVWPALAALLAGAGVWLLRRKREVLPDISEEKLVRVIIPGILLITFLVQLYFLPSIALPMRLDFGRVRATAIKLGLQGKFSDSRYFSMCPNNLGITFLLACLMRILRHWKLIIALGIFLVDLSIGRAALAVSRLTGDRRRSVWLLIAGILLIGFNYRTFIPYSDNYSMAFMVFPICWYLERKESPAFRLAGAVMMGTACYMKITCAIFLIALLLLPVFCGARPDFRWDRKKILPAVILLAVFAGTYGAWSQVGKRVMVRSGFKQDVSMERGIWHYFMMGQNDRTFGAISESDSDFTESLGSPEEKRRENIRVGLERIRNRGFAGNVLFYLKKNYQNYCDGVFNISRKLKSGYHYPDTLPANIMVNNGPVRSVFVFIEQTVWLGILMLILLTSLRGAKSAVRERALLQLVILGVSAYTLIFESRAKYLYLFLPVYLMLAGLFSGREKDVSGEPGGN